ncbi:MAG TPA: RdgB/HAM1 family non-canonical purine NTP pyrophosphatase [Rudaea sp.]|nr:RdgB/HAM1 family non-canonical purine NTP pyrophosphatase [Rudaea sp.]
MKIVVASSNRGKLIEIREILGAEFELIAQSELGIEDADETASTFVENALLKARNAARASGMPALGDDSGLCVDALNGAPGLYSARYAGEHGNATANIAKLLDAMRDVEKEKRTAHFHCSIVLVAHADDPAPIIAEGRWYGRILDAPRGDRGFGYDPIFFDPASNAGAGELDSTVKNRVSHRGQALANLRQLMKSDARA